MHLRKERCQENYERAFDIVNTYIHHQCRQMMCKGAYTCVRSYLFFTPNTANTFKSTSKAFYKWDLDTLFLTNTQRPISCSFCSTLEQVACAFVYSKEEAESQTFKFNDIYSTSRFSVWNEGMYPDHTGIQAFASRIVILRRPCLEFFELPTWITGITPSQICVCCFFSGHLKDWGRHCKTI